LSEHYRSIFAAGLFKGKVVVVTGGGSGIGRCIAHELASLGAHVVLIGRKLPKLFDVAGEIAADGGRASFHACDIRDEETVTNTVQAIMTVKNPSITPMQKGNPFLKPYLPATDMTIILLGPGVNAVNTI
jgi:NAD(P)-dependent dehydrogenase (short-subunit alcohol dehydrogenase family)